MVAKVPPVTNGGRFPKTAFDIDLEAGTVTCPAGHTTSTTQRTKDHKGRKATLFLFPAEVCAACPLRDQCTGGTGGRRITVGRHEARIAAARAAQDEPATKALLRRRAKIERKIDHLQDLGMRKARYRGRRRTKLQALLAATVANIKRLVVLDAFTAAPAIARETSTNVRGGRLAGMKATRPPPTASPPPRHRSSTTPATPTAHRQRLETGCCCSLTYAARVRSWSSRARSLSRSPRPKVQSKGWATAL